MKTLNQINNNSRYFSLIIFSALFFLVVFSSLTSIGQDNRTNSGLSTVIIDAGHGGKDPGAVVGNAKEKEIVLDIALRLGKLLKKNLPDLKVIYTRDGDYFVPLFQRSEIANSNKANLFISIHANFCSTPSVKGTETYILGLHRNQDNLDVARKENSVIVLEEDHTQRYEGFDPNSEESYIAFELIQNNYMDQSVIFADMVQDLFREQAGRPDRDVRQAGFLVLRETAMPSVLIEAGYLSNKAEAAYLMTANGRETIASAIFRSIKNYKSRFDSRLNIASAEFKNRKEESEITNIVNKNEDKAIAEKKDDDKLPVIKTKKSNNIPAEKVIESNSADQYTYAVQIAASKSKLPKTLKMFNGIKSIKEVQIAGYFKYYCYESPLRSETAKYLADIKKRIPDAFLVGMKNGDPISVESIPDLKPKN